MIWSALASCAVVLLLCLLVVFALCWFGHVKYLDLFLPFFDGLVTVVFLNHTFS